MTDLVTLTALARIYAGDWIADCPRPGCTNAEFVHPNQWDFFCGAYASGRGQDLGSYCQWRGPITWPGNAYDLTMELARRPVKLTRNWYPANYPRTRVLGTTPLGQSVAELADEFMRNDPATARTRP